MGQYCAVLVPWQGVLFLRYTLVCFSVHPVGTVTLMAYLGSTICTLAQIKFGTLFLTKIKGFHFPNSPSTMIILRYGVPALQETVLKQAMNKLVPDLVKGDKSVWLSSDTVMVPPTMLADQKVSLSRTVQKSGQFVVVWPRAFTSSISAGMNPEKS